MKFQIARISPVYCPSRDGLIGNRATVLPMAYFSEALAHKLAGRMEHRSFEQCGDDCFVVIPYGANPFTARLAAWPGPDYPMPW